MYVTEPAGALSLPEEYLRAMLADSAAFRTLCGAADAAGALDHIYRDGLPPPADGREFTPAELSALRPHAIIFLADSDGLTLDRDSAEGFLASGRAMIALERDCPSSLGDEPTSDANRQWKNIIGQIMYDLCDLTAEAKPGYLQLTRIRLHLGPFWPEKKDAIAQGLWQGAVLEVRWSGA